MQADNSGSEDQLFEGWDETEFTRIKRLHLTGELPYSDRELIERRQAILQEVNALFQEAETFGLREDELFSKTENPSGNLLSIPDNGSLGNEDSGSSIPPSERETCCTPQQIAEGLLKIRAAYTTAVARVNKWKGCQDWSAILAQAVAPVLPPCWEGKFVWRIRVWPFGQYTPFDEGDTFIHHAYAVCPCTCAKFGECPDCVVLDPYTITGAAFFQSPRIYSFSDWISQGNVWRASTIPDHDNAAIYRYTMRYYCQRARLGGLVERGTCQAVRKLLMRELARYTGAQGEVLDNLYRANGFIPNCCVSSNIFRAIPSGQIRKVGIRNNEFGFQYFGSGVELSLPDDLNQPTVSQIILLENDQPLGPAHASHAEIQQVGQGRYSHWNDGSNTYLYFSTSDNSDPRTNGRTYTITIDSSGTSPNLEPVITTQPTSQSITLGNQAFFTVVAQGDNSAGTLRYTWLIRRVGDEHANQIGGNFPSIEFIPTLADNGARLWVAVANDVSGIISNEVSLTVVDHGPTLPTPVVIGTLSPNVITKIDGEYPGEFGFRIFASQVPSLADIPADSNNAPNASPLILLENNEFLGFAHSSHSDIESIGQGRYSHWNGGGGAELRFSTSNNSDPRTNGMVYEVAVPTGTPLATIPNDFMTKVEGEHGGSLGYRVNAANLNILARLSSDSSSSPNASPLVLLENGIPVGQAHSPHTDIQRIGQGRYSHWNGGRNDTYLWFSTPDNSDPRTNGRTYAIAV